MPGLRLFLLLMLGLPVWLAPAGAAHAKQAAKKKSTVIADEVEGGQHWRFKTDKGVVHVWIPEGYQAKSAGTVVYVHGYYTSADESWKQYRLARQFKASKQNAVFVVPDAPRGNDDGLKYDTLTNLLKQVWKHTRLARPWGSIVVIGHSGAFRSIVPWLDYTAIDHVILLDALYSAESKFKTWLTGAKGHESNKITIVGQDTSGKAEGFVRQFKGVVRKKKVPASWDDFSKTDRTARVLYIQSQFGHMELVSNGKVIPLLLRRTPLKPVGWQPPPDPEQQAQVEPGGVVWKDPQPFGK